MSIEHAAFYNGFFTVDPYKSRCHIRKEAGASPSCNTPGSEVDWSVEATVECDKFVYDRSVYTSTVATEFDLGKSTCT